MRNVESAQQLSVEFILRKNPRAKHVRISVAYDGVVTVTIPSRAPAALAEKYVRVKADWIRAKQAHFAKLNLTPLPKLTRREVAAQKREARALVHLLVAKFSAAYNVRPGKISIRNQRTRWGSCTKQGNLSFNFRIISLVPELQDYVVVHELCHLQEFNHSKKFWAQVATTIPDYLARRKQLRGRMM